MIPKIIYEVDYNKFGKQLVPRLIRQPKLLAWVKALIAPLVSRYNAFYEFKTKQIYITGHNAQITLFEQALNDAFDVDDRRIFIENSIITDSDHYYDEEFGEPLEFFDNEDEGIPIEYLDPEAYNQTGGNFAVYVPEALKPVNETALHIFETSLKGEIERYKIYGTKYTIEYYA